MDGVVKITTGRGRRRQSTETPGMAVEGSMELPMEACPLQRVIRPGKLVQGCLDRKVRYGDVQGVRFQQGADFGDSR